LASIKEYSLRDFFWTMYCKFVGKEMEEAKKVERTEGCGY